MLETLHDGCISFIAPIRRHLDKLGSLALASSCPSPPHRLRLLPCRPRQERHDRPAVRGLGAEERLLLRLALRHAEAPVRRLHRLRVGRQANEAMGSATLSLRSKAMGSATLSLGRRRPITTDRTRHLRKVMLDEDATYLRGRRLLHRHRLRQHLKPAERVQTYKSYIRLVHPRSPPTQGMARMGGLAS